MGWDTNGAKAAKGANSDITSLSGLTTPLSVAQGGTGGTTAATARSALGAAAKGANSDITSLAGLTTAIPVSEGGTGAISAATARSNLGVAASGANTDITSLDGITINNYTKLGSDAPAIKIKKITGTCASVGGNATAAHGLTQAKIIGMTGLVLTNNDTLVPHQYNNDIFRWDFYVDSEDVVVRTAGSGTGVAGRPFTVLLTYTE